MQSTQTASDNREGVRRIMADEKERLAVLEHRAKTAEQAIDRLSRCLSKQADIQSELTRIASNNEHLASAVKSIAEELSADRKSNQSKHESLLEKITANEIERKQDAGLQMTRDAMEGGLVNMNASWISFGKAILIAMLGAAFGFFLPGLGD